MFAQSLACVFLLVAGATTQETTEGFLSIETISPSILPSILPSVIESESTGACSNEVCVVEPCTPCPLTSPLRTSETGVPTDIPQLTFCRGTYTTGPCMSSAEMSIPPGETPISTTSEGASSTGGSSSAPAATSTPTESSSGSESPSDAPTSSSSGSAESSTSTPGAASSVFTGDRGFVWVAAISTLSAAVGFVWTLL